MANVKISGILVEEAASASDGDLFEGEESGGTSFKIAFSVIKSTLQTAFGAIFAPIAKGVTNGDTHDHSGGDGAQIDHGGLAGLTDKDHDAGAITYTPTVVTDWDGDADPGDADDALDQLAERVDDLEIAPPSHAHDAGVITYTPSVLADWDGDADPGDTDNALDQLAERVDDLEITPPSHAHDADVITYTPLVLADWDGNADPGDTDDALDQLAERVDDLELAEFNIEVIIGNGVDAITVDTPVPVIEAPCKGTIKGWTIVADASGSIVVDVWKDTYSLFPPTVADTIAGSEKPTLSSAQKNQDLSLSSWTVSVTKGDWFKFNIDSVSTVKLVTLSIRCEKAP